METLALVEQDLSAVPDEVAKEHGPVVKELNLSENALTDGASLAEFTAMHTLVLDKNNLRDLSCLPRLPSVKTLWFNNNLVDDLTGFMDQVSEKLPSLTMLSLMRNPAAPPLVTTSEEEAASAARYRLYIIYRLPSLAFLDSAPVTADERREAQAKGKFLAVRKAKPRRTSAAPAGEASPAIPSVFGTSPGSAAGAGAGSPPAEGGPEKRTPTAYLGLGHSRYDGRHSEGNRFIVDTDL